MEVWDAYNKEFEKIQGMTLIRGEAIPDGVYHLVTDIIVKHTDGDYLLMQRDTGKHLGGMWEASAGGSALQGESPLACAIHSLYLQIRYAQTHAASMYWKRSVSLLSGKMRIISIIELITKKQVDLATVNYREERL